METVPNAHHLMNGNRRGLPLQWNVIWRYKQARNMDTGYNKMTLEEVLSASQSADRINHLTPEIYTRRSEQAGPER